MNTSALTKPRYSILHVAIFALTLLVTLPILRNWSDFKDGFRDGYDYTAGKAGQK